MVRTLAAALFALTLAATASAAPPPKTVTFQAKQGTVTYQHDAHAKRAGACKACHEGAPKKLEGKDQAHKLCLDCHKEKKAGPTKCAECHVKA